MAIRTASPTITSWIPPQQQLKEITEPFVNDIAKQIPESVFPCVIRRMIAEFAIDLRLTHWYTVLEDLHMLPDVVPKLPDMSKILMSTCPIFGGKVIDSFTLMLLPGQSKSLNITVECIQRRSRKYHLADPGSLQMRTFWDKAAQEHGRAPRSVPMQWHLTSTRTIPGSHKVKLSRQKNMITNLNKAGLQYRSLSVKTAPIVLFFHFTATGERLYQEANMQKTGHPTFSYVEETVEGTPLAIGGFSKNGLIIHRAPKDSDHNDIGVGSGVERIFS